MRKEIKNTPEKVQKNGRVDVLKRTWIDASNMDETQAVSVPTAILKTCVHLTKLNEEDG